MHRAAVSAFAILALLTTSPPLLAHHGTAGVYDQKKAVKIEGVVKQFSWRNPHSALFIEGSSEAGATGTIVIEMGAPSALLNDYGIPKSMFKPGDRVVISMHPSYSNPNSGQAMQNHFWVNGVEFRSENKKE
jgi:Family of unknown function (DUF6152)